MTENTLNPLLIFAPVSGTTVAIDTVPDAVFAQKMLGDGVAIDPVSSELVAPCDGTVVNIHSAHHALTLATEAGIDVLIHIGLETVMLKGKGFDVVVTAGQKVRKGDVLIKFDADYIRRNAKSLLTEIVITNGEKAASVFSEAGKTVGAGKDVVLKIEPSSFPPEHMKEAVNENASVRTAESWVITVPNVAGLHARPTAVLAAAAKKFASDVVLVRGADTANLKSIVSVMGADVKKGDEVRLKATGVDAVEALSELIPLLESGSGEDPNTAPAVAEEPEEPSAAVQSGSDDVLTGIPASGGVAVGRVVQVREADIAVEEYGETADREIEKLSAALERAKEQLEALQSETAEKTDAGKAAVFQAHRELLDDPELSESVRNIIGKGRSAAFAWKQSINEQAEMLSGLKNSLLAARANDLRDVGRRVLRLLTGEKAPQKRDLPDQAILIAEDLTPSDTAGLDRSKVVGFCTKSGGATSHVAILARSLALPAIAGIDARALDLPDGTMVVLDGGAGTLSLNPDEEKMAEAQKILERDRTRKAENLAQAHLPAITTDGKPIEVAGNIGGVADAEEVFAFGGDGIGLLRSEFLFLQRQNAPSEEEQADVYSRIAEIAGEKRSLIVRTLDVGGDKPLPYLPGTHEDNPFLGVRGVRLCLRRPDVFRTQIRAVLQAAGKTKMRLMFPMVTTVDELREAKAIVEEERLKTNAPFIEVGIMVEVPAAAVMADVLAEHADFFSIGTNDLTQYVLAMDRGNPDLGKQADGLEPAVLRMIARTVEGAAKYGRFVGVCGGLAGEEAAVPLLIGLGVDELSVAAPLIPDIKAQVRRLSVARCRKLAGVALKMSSAAEVRDAVAAFNAQQV